MSHKRTIIETDIVLGEKYKDNVSGLEGIAVAVSKFQFGCLRVGLQPSVDKDGKVPESHWVDEPQLEGIAPIKKSPGGPKDTPQRNPDPTR